MNKPIDKERADAHYSGMLAELTGPASVKMDIDQSREYLIAYMKANFTDRTFTNYINGRLAGDFAWQMANALAATAPAPADLTKELIEAVEIMIIGACACAIPHQGERDTMKMALEMARATLAKVRSQA